MYERPYSGNIVIACEGPSEPEKAATGFGEITSRSGARLDYVRADAELVFNKWSKDKNTPKGASISLENPSIADVEKAIAKVSHALCPFPQEATGIDIYFAGHGRLIDGAFSAKKLYETIENNLKNGAGLRGVSMMMDSCYSGAFLIELLIQNQQSSNLDFRDGLFSSLPNEKSWEMSFLEHGAFTFTQMNPGNGYVDSNLLTKAIEQNDHKVIAKYMQSAVGNLSNSTAFLTQARQHPINVYKGDLLTIKGYGSYSVYEDSEDETIEFGKVALALREIVEKF